MKAFLVVYFYSVRGEQGYGNINFTCNYDTPTIESIRDTEKQIREANHFDGVVILNIIKLESEDTE